MAATRVQLKLNDDFSRSALKYHICNARALPVYQLTTHCSSGVYHHTPRPRAGGETAASYTNQSPGPYGEKEMRCIAP